MIKVGITGGIGSGKSTVCALLAARGAAVYDSDAAARRLMEEDGPLREGLVARFGAAVYRDGQLDRSYLAGVVFGNALALVDLNALVHPAVRRDFEEWAARQTGASGVVELLPKYFGMLPIPMWLVFALLFFVGPLMGGSLTMIAICVPMMVEIWPDSLLSVFILCMSMTYIIMQIAPTHICLTLCAEDYKITLGDLIPKVAPMAVVATVFVFIYFFALRAIGL